MAAIEAACPVSYAACEEEDGCMFVIDAALHGGGPPRRGSDVLMAFVDCITGGGDMGASISTNPLSTNDKCPATCLPPQDTAMYSAQLSEDNPTGAVLLPYDVDGVGWAILTLRQGVTCESCAAFHFMAHFAPPDSAPLAVDDVVFPDRLAGRAGQSAIRAKCCPDSPQVCSCATRVRLVLVGPDGDSVVAVSTGLGAARGNFISKMAGAEAAKDGIPSTRNSP